MSYNSGSSTKSARSGLVDFEDGASQHSGVESTKSKVSQYSRAKLTLSKASQHSDHSSLSKGQTYQIEVKERLRAIPITKQSQLDRYRELFASQPLDDKKIDEGLDILLWLLSNKFIDQKLFAKGCAEIVES